MYDALSLELQNIIMYNYGVFGKTFLFIILIMISTYYLFFYKKNDNELFNYSLGTLHFIGNIFSRIFLFTLPFWFMIFSPEYTLENTLDFFFIGLFYPTMILGVSLFAIDVLKLGLEGALATINIDINSNEKLKNWIKCKINGRKKY